jgi:A/G-specific adenine glycosylase
LPKFASVILSKIVLFVKCEAGVLNYVFSKIFVMEKLFSSILIDWYHNNRRDLPWRETSDPYLIWVSEIILQQTRVAQGLDYYYRFINQFPTVTDLANAMEDDVLKAWQGLGYYSRARNMHKGAKLVTQNYQSVFPVNYDDVISLPGIGSYTAAAICSFAYNQAYAVVDGNVYRVLSRVFGIHTPIDSAAGKQEFLSVATSVLNPDFPALHNQAIMEFGALQCVPQSPDCEVCSLKTFCSAYLNNDVHLLPVKDKKTKVRNRYFNYLVLHAGDISCVQKREKDDIWKNLYEFPLIETSEEVSLAFLLELSEFKSLIYPTPIIQINSNPKVFKHVLSHQIIYAKFWEIELGSLDFQELMRVDRNELQNLPTSKLMENYIKVSSLF